MKILNLLLLCVLFFRVPTQAQWNWVNPQETPYPVIQGQGFVEEIGKTYVRFPDRAKGDIRMDVWNLSRQSAGLSIRFYSDASQIMVRYGVGGGLALPNMPTLGVSGVDLYSIDAEGGWMRRPASNYTFGKDTVRYTWKGLPKEKYHKLGYEYCLYLPLYNSMNWMEIGIPEGSSVEFLPLQKEKPIVVYGTSIAQGASASRPGMAWTNILSRTLDYPLINLGFSGNGRLEKKVIDYVNEIDARLYVLDCIPNLKSVTGHEVDSLTRNAVTQIRSIHPTTPILLVEHASGCNSYGNQEFAELNRQSRKVYEVLISEGVKELHYLACSDINLPGDALTDYVHPSDLGMQIQANAYEKKIRAILNMPQGASSTTQAVTQRREPHIYEWKARHREVLKLNTAQPPKAVIIGNSITHYWAGEPIAPIQSGTDSWQRVMSPAGFRNLGYGHDRIENALWRVYHGELDGYNAEKVVLMIGTNNLYINTEEEIVEGLQNLLTVIRQRQPSAKIKVIGILPRRGAEPQVKSLNRSIHRMVEQHKHSFVDVGNLLLQSDGKIDEKLFRDGLHPNTKGYDKIAMLIAE